MTRFLTATATLLLHAATLAAKEPCDGMLKNWDGDPVHW